LAAIDPFLDLGFEPSGIRRAPARFVLGLLFRGEVQRTIRIAGDLIGQKAFVARALREVELSLDVWCIVEEGIPFLTIPPQQQLEPTAYSNSPPRSSSTMEKYHNQLL
jgi:hypothetical protein